MKSRAILHSSSLSLALATALLSSCSSLPSKKGDEGYIIPKDTHSPDHRYGVMVPVFDSNSDDTKPEKRRNQVVELKHKKVVAVIPGDFPGYDRTLNHHGMGVALWSDDSSLLLWHVDGKWCPDILALVKIQNGKAVWQLDVLHAAQREILDRTRKARPERYAAVKKENAGSGSAYPDGFTVDVAVANGQEDSFPLAVRADLSANPKGIEDYPANLDSYMDGIVKEDGTFTVKSFKFGHRPGGGGRW